MNENRNQAPLPPTGYPRSVSSEEQKDSTENKENSNFDDLSFDQKEYIHETPSIEEAPTRVHNSSRKREKGSFGKTFLAGFLGAAVACALAGGCFIALDGDLGATNSTVLGSNGGVVLGKDNDQDRAEAVAEKVLPSVVGIDVYQADANSSRNGLFSNADGDSQSLVNTGLGSGVIISTDGYILTNYHVVEGADALKVTAAGREYEGEVVGTDELSDLAVVKIDAHDLTAIEIGDSSTLASGQWVMAAGSPFGLEQSVATGIVSATSRTVTVSNSSSDGYSYYYGNGQNSVSIYSNMIQTDAAINPGNSGGALVDAAGRLIGINSVIESASGNYAGVGFAIPVDYAINIAQQIIDGKTPTHAQLGVSATTINSSIAQRYNMPVSEGAYLSAVYQGSPAAEAGLEDGDIITAIDDAKIESSTDLVAACRGHQVGDKVTVTFIRNGEEHSSQVTLGSDDVSFE